MIDQIDVSYGEQWGSHPGPTHPEPLSAAVAERRHAAGHSYAVLLSAQDRPLALAEYWGARQEWRVHLFDDRSRRVQLVDLAPYPDNALRVTRDTRTLRTGAERRSDAWAAQTTIRISPDGRVDIETATDWDAWQARYETQARGGGSVELDSATLEQFSIPGDDPFAAAAAGQRARLVAYPSANGHDRSPILLAVPAPRFGEWEVFADLLAARGHELAPAITLGHADMGDTEPLRSEGIERLLAPGAAVDTVAGPAVIEVADAGTVRVPTGRLAAADPGWVEQTRRPVDVPPGAYPVTLSLMRFPDGSSRVGAAQVSIRGLPVSTWDMALHPDEDVLLLGPGQFYGVGVDTGYAAFLDAGHDPLEEDAFDALLDALETDPATDFTTPESPDLNVIAVSAGLGDGTYPLWVGRSEDGQVSCVVLDFRLAAPA